MFYYLYCSYCTAQHQYYSFNVFILTCIAQNYKMQCPKMQLHYNELYVHCIVKLYGKSKVNCSYTAVDYCELQVHFIQM